MRVIGYSNEQLLYGDIGRIILPFLLLLFLALSKCVVFAQRILCCFGDNREEPPDNDDFSAHFLETQPPYQWSLPVQKRYMVALTTIGIVTTESRVESATSAVG